MEGENIELLQLVELVVVVHEVNYLVLGFFQI